jgi:hypothetical protein
LQLKKQKEKTGAKTKPGGIIMVVQCKSEFFVTGEVFLLDIGLLMGAIVFTPLQRFFIVTYETKC